MPLIRSLCLAVVLVIAEFSGIAVGVDSQSLVLSAPGSTYNYLPSAAVSSRSGGVLVAWAEWKSSTDCQIWIVFCRPKGSKGYAVGKPKKISAPSLFNFYPEVVYHPDLDQFLVGWQAAEENLQEVHEQWTSIMRVSSQGKPVGARIDEDYGGGENGPLKIFPIQQKGTAPVATEPYYLLLLNRYPLSWSDRETTGLYAGNLGMDGKLLSPVKQVKQGQWEDDTAGSSGQYWYYGIMPNDGCASADGSYFVIGLSQLQPPNDNWYYDALAFSCKPDGSLINSAMLDTNSAYAPSINGLPKNNYFASWQLTTSKVTTYYNRKLNKTLKPIGPEKVALKKKNIPFSCVVDLGADPGLYQVSATAARGASVPLFRDRTLGPASLSLVGTYSPPSARSAGDASPGLRTGGLEPAGIAYSTVYGSYIKPNGKAAKATKLFPHGGAIQGLTAVGLPSSNAVFVVWSDGSSVGTYILRGFVFNAK